jgi:hypothetical protein
MLNVAPESTKNDNLLWLSFNKNNPEPCEKDIADAVFRSAVSSQCSVCVIGRAHRLPASGKGKYICKIYAGIVVIPGNSVVAILRVVVGHLHPAGAAARW